MKFFTLSILIISVSTSAFATPKLTEFSTDICSRFPDGLPGKLPKWRDCCIEHDIYYWLGGTKEQRKRADTKLAHCVANKGGRTLDIIGKGMYVGVRLGGAPWFNLSYSWGYGWTNNYIEILKPYGPGKGHSLKRKIKLEKLRGYFTLTQDEIQHSIELIQNSSLLNKEMKDTAIKNLYLY